MSCSSRPAPEAPAGAANPDPVDRADDSGGSDDEDEQEPAPREKPLIPGADLEVDIVREGEAALRGESEYDEDYEDREGQKKYITEVVCDDLILLGGGGREGTSAPGDFERPVSMPRSAQRPQPAASSAPAEDFNQGITDDDVPF